MNKWSKNIFLTFDEADLSGIVYFANTFKMAHQCIEQFIVDQGIKWSVWFHHPEWAVPIKQASCDYVKPLRAGQNAMGTVALVQVGHTSINFETQLLQNTLCATIQTVHVFMDRKDEKKRAIPDLIRDKLGGFSMDLASKS